MPRVLVATLVAMIISIVVGPKFIEFLRRNEFGQHIREEVPEHHQAKQGTPVMGGLLIVLAAIVAFLALSHYTWAALTILFVTLSCAAIGFTDDLIKITNRRSLGLSGRWKLAWMVAITVVVGFLTHHFGLQHERAVFVPFVDQWYGLGWGWYVLLFVIIAGAANGVNLADGVDGLAAGTGIISLFTFTAMSAVSFIRSSPGSAALRDVNKLDMAIWGAALIGGAIGFLWFNAAPAEIFMGDTGSLALGGALAGFAVMTKTELLLILVGGIFVIEALSVMLQVASFKYWKRRVFLMAPIHHHFEMKAWSATKIMVRFWIVTAILAAAGFALYYAYYLPALRAAR
ncbi:MAG TPA: phospho-N-acetylmuramoyl-pentapeptide-transferase [Gaiellaceae bacterium]|jgi:phospho-N-acetylmuramoyl-pentapeptide-transferase|nr:phospho-N-acetylmuramoyl-pentapeptide-transferase [Gaiellaceae bacterium]